MKCFLPLVSIVLLLMSLPTPSAASPQAFLKVNQYYLLFTNPVVPYINHQGSFVVGLRGFSDFIGAQVIASPHSEIVRLGGDSVKFIKASKTAYINGVAVEMVKAPQERLTIQPNARVLPPALRRLFLQGPATQMLVPVALLARAFRFQSYWDAKTRSVRLQRKDLVLFDGSIDTENLERFERPVLTEDDLVPVKAVVRSGAISYGNLPPPPAEAKKGKLLELTVKNASHQDLVSGQAYINIFSNVFDRGMPMPSADIPNVVPPALKAGSLRLDITEIKGESTGNYVSYVSTRLVVRDLTSK